MSAAAQTRPSDFDPATGRAIPDWEARKPRFGVLARFGETFRLAFRLRPLTFLLVVPLLVILLPTIVLALGLVTSATSDGASATLEGLPFLMLLLSFPVSFIGVGLAAVVGHDGLNGVRRPFGETLRGLLRQSGKIVVLGFAALTLIAVGNAVFPLLGLWVASVVCLVMPAILVDGAGWRALGRSRRLTKEYRWPIVGLTLLVSLAGVLAVIVGSAILTVATGADVFVGFTGLMMLVAVLTTVVPSLALVPVVHARLVAIKESGAARDLGAVFD